MNECIISIHDSHTVAIDKEQLEHIHIAIGIDFQLIILDVPPKNNSVADSVCATLCVAAILNFGILRLLCCRTLCGRAALSIETQ